MTLSHIIVAAAAAAALVLGLLLGLLLHSRLGRAEKQAVQQRLELANQELQERRDELRLQQQEHSALSEAHHQTQRDRAVLQDRVEALTTSLQELRQQQRSDAEQIISLTTRLTQQEAQYQHLKT